MATIPEGESESSCFSAGGEESPWAARLSEEGGEEWGGMVEDLGEDGEDIHEYEGNVPRDSKVKFVRNDVCQAGFHDFFISPWPAVNYPHILDTTSIGRLQP